MTAADDQPVKPKYLGKYYTLENVSIRVERKATDRYLVYGFEACEGGPEKCDRCSQVTQLYFGDRDYWDCREGSSLCGECLDARIAADVYVTEMMEKQKDHEATHMPWMW